MNAGLGTFDKLTAEPDSNINLSEYILNENSRFLDIGSGFGKPCFNASYISGCLSHGVEIQALRY